MPAVLRAIGADFDVDAFLDGSTLPIVAVKRRGEPVRPISQPEGRRYDKSSINVTVSDAGFHELPRQVAEATAFLRSEYEQVRRLLGFPGVEGVTLDFGVGRRDVAMQSDTLDADLVRMAGSLGLSLEISRYWSISEDDDT